MLIGQSSLKLPSLRCVESFNGMERRRGEAFRRRKLTGGTEGGATSRIGAFHLHVTAPQLEQAAENGFHESIGNRGYLPSSLALTFATQS
jgi:hypothetical protein